MNAQLKFRYDGIDSINTASCTQDLEILERGGRCSDRCGDKNRVAVDRCRCATSGVEHTGSPNTCTLGEREVEAAVKSIVRRFATATHLYASRVTQRRSAMADGRSVPLPKSCARARHCSHATFIAENFPSPNSLPEIQENMRLSRNCFEC